MQILIISDIHANSQALDACLTAAPKYDHVFNLGDVVGYGASPNEVVARSRSLAGLLVRGNHDKACSGVSDASDFNHIAALAAYWTKQKLTPENLEWVRTLPQGPVVPPEAPGTQCVHGSPLDEDEYIIVVRDATVGPEFGTLAVSGCATSIISKSIPKASATICEKTVLVPCPISVLAVNTRTRPVDEASRPTTDDK